MVTWPAQVHTARSYGATIQSQVPSEAGVVYHHPTLPPKTRPLGPARGRNLLRPAAGTEPVWMRETSSPPEPEVCPEHANKDPSTVMIPAA